MNLILDMDDTLIHCFDQNNMSDITERPFLQEFFEYVFEKCETVSIWTYGTQWWFDQVYNSVLKHLIPPNKSFYFVWCRPTCKFIWKYNTSMMIGNRIQLIIRKPLSKVYKTYPDRFFPQNTLILDDTPETYAENKENAIFIRPFRSRFDTELVRVKKSLDNYLSGRGTDVRSW